MCAMSAQTPIQSVLFPELNDRIVDLENFNRLESVEGVYDSKTFKVVFETYMGLLLIQYILIYAGVPFDDIENRPVICIISSLYCLFMFGTNATLLPLCSTNMPTIVTFRVLVCSLVLEFGELVLSVAAAILCLNAPLMYSYEYDSMKKVTTKVQVTTYIQVISVVSMAVNTIAFVVLLMNVILSSHAIKNYYSKIDRRVLKNSDRFVELETELPREVQMQQMKAYAA